MTRVELQPSHFDRLDPVAQAIRWWTSQMAEMLSNRTHKPSAADAIEADKVRLSRNVLILLSDKDGFTAHTRVPKGSADEHLKAISLRVPDLAPIDPSALTIVTTAVKQNEDGGVTYELAMARKDRLDQLEAAARRRGASSVLFSTGSSSSIELRSPRSARRASRNLVMDAALTVMVIAAAVVAVATWTLKVNEETQALAEQERAIRRAAVAMEASRDAGEVSRQLVERGILTRRGSAALKTIAILNAATPDDTWWTSLRWSPTEIAISGQSPNASAAINALSASTKDWSIELAGPLNSASSEGLQSFDVIARPRGGQLR